MNRPLLISILLLVVSSLVINNIEVTSAPTTNLLHTDAEVSLPRFPIEILERIRQLTQEPRDKSRFRLVEPSLAKFSRLEAFREADFAVFKDRAAKGDIETLRIIKE